LATNQASFLGWNWGKRNWSAILPEPPEYLLVAAPYFFSLYGFLLVAIGITVAMPFSVGVNGGLISTLALLALLRAWLERKGTRFDAIPTKVNISGVGMLALCLVGYTALTMAWAPSGSNSWGAVERKLAWVVFSLVLAYWPPTRKQADTVLFCYVIALGILFLFAISFATSLSGQTGFAYRYFFYGTSLVYPFQLHRVYTALHVLFGLGCWLILGRGWLNNVGNKTVQVVLYTAGALVLLSFELMLASRIMLGVTALIGLGATVLALINGDRLRAGIFALGLGVLVVIASFAPPVRQAFEAIANGKNIAAPDRVVLDDGIATRYYIWKASFAELSQRTLPEVLFGTGGGSGRLALLPHYQKMNFKLGVKEAFDTHNQYLLCLLDTGIVGLSLLLALLFAAGRQAYAIITNRHVSSIIKNPYELNMGEANRSALPQLKEGILPDTHTWIPNTTLFQLLALITGLMCAAMLTECQLEAQKGTVFFAFFMLLLVSCYKSDSPKRLVKP
jgi:O-antigen ligase